MGGWKWEQECVPPVFPLNSDSLPLTWPVFEALFFPVFGEFPAPGVYDALLAPGIDGTGLAEFVSSILSYPHIRICLYLILFHPVLSYLISSYLESTRLD